MSGLLLQEFCIDRDNVRESHAPGPLVPRSLTNAEGRSQTAPLSSLEVDSAERRGSGAGKKLVGRCWVRVYLDQYYVSRCRLEPRT